MTTLLEWIIPALGGIAALLSLILYGVSKGRAETKKTKAEAKKIAAETQKITAELSPNHGSSMKDAVNRIEKKVTELDGRLADTVEIYVSLRKSMETVNSTTAQLADTLAQLSGDITTVRHEQYEMQSRLFGLEHPTAKAEVWDGKGWTSSAGGGRE